MFQVLGQKSHNFCCLIVLGMIRLMILLCFLKKTSREEGRPQRESLFVDPNLAPHFIIFLLMWLNSIFYLEFPTGMSMVLSKWIFHLCMSRLDTSPKMVITQPNLLTSYDHFHGHPRNPRNWKILRGWKLGIGRSLLTLKQNYFWIVLHYDL